MNDGDSLFVGLLCAGAVCVLVILIDGWFLRPRRDPGATSAAEPMLPKLAGYALVGLALAMLWRLFRYEAVDFSLMLVVVGAVVRHHLGARRAFFARRRKVAAAAAGTPRGARARAHRGGICALVLSRHHAGAGDPLVSVRAVSHPVRFDDADACSTAISSSSASISYGLRLPVTNTLMFATGTPHRGDVIVFRLPPNPKINYIKRLVGLPGDRIRVDENNQLYVNGKPVPQQPGPAYTGPKQDLWNYVGAPTAFEQLDSKRHRIMFANGRGKTGEWVVPPGHYFFMGDNRNNSKDSRWLDEPMRRGSFRSRIWWVKRCEFGLILILVTDLSGEGSGIRLNRGSY